MRLITHGTCSGKADEIRSIKAWLYDSREDEAGVARFFSEQSARSVKPQDGMARNPKVWKACWVIAAGASALASTCLRFCLGGSRR